ncbi:uncharacterized protein METZ01_LOCUS369250, partial [marine metagenome]
MNFSRTAFSVFLFFLHFLSGQTITSVNAPKIILENIEFAITYSGEFKPADTYKLDCNGTSFLPTNLDSDQIKFQNLSVHQSGEVSFNLLHDDIPIDQLTRHSIKPWVSVLPP